MAANGLFMTLLWLLAAAGIVFFVRWLNRFLKSNFDLSSDTQLLVMIAFTGLITLGTLNFLWNLDTGQDTAASNTPDASQTEVSDLDQVLQEHFAELYAARMAVKKRLQELDTFFREVRQWAAASPKQAQFLQNIVDIRWDSYEELRQADQVVDRSLRQFWIHYHTGQKEYVIGKFRQQADHLLDRIKSAQAFDNTADQEEQEEIVALLKKTSQQLAHEDIPKTPKKPRQPIDFKPYSPENRQMLIDWLNRQQENMSTLTINLDDLQDNQRNIDETLQELQTFLAQKQNQDLVEPMQPTIRQWREVRRYNQYAEYQILYAIEVEYLLDKLLRENPAPNADVRWAITNTRDLHAQLLELAPRIANRARERRISDIGQSYEPVEPEKKRR